MSSAALRMLTTLPIGGIEQQAQGAAANEPRAAPPASLAPAKGQIAGGRCREPVL